MVNMNEGSFGYLQMRRVGSYGGPSGVAGSERLKQRLSLTPGLHLLSSSYLGDAGFLAAVGDTQDERVIHRTFGAARNFFAIASNLKQVKQNSWVNRKAPLAPLVKDTIIFDEPFDSYQLCHGAREGGVQGIPDVRSNDSLVEEVEFEEAFQISSSSNHLSDTSTSARFDTGNDKHQGNLILKSEVALNLFPGRVDISWNEIRSPCSWAGAGLQRKESDPVEVSSNANSPPFGLSDNQKCESSVLGAHLESGEVQCIGSHLETERMSIAIAEADGCVFSLPTSDGQDSRTSRVEKFEANSAGNVVICSNEVSHLQGTGAGLQDSKIDLSKDMAAVEIQSCWRGWQERKHFKLVKDRVAFFQSLVLRNQESCPYDGISHAAMLPQQYWRAFQGLEALKRRKTEKASREQHKINIAAGVVQKHWRAQRGRCLVKHLKEEQVAREQRRIGAAAVVLQKHWRAWRGSFLGKHLKMEQAVKEKQRMDIAAIVLQKHWREQQGRSLMKHLRIEKVGKEKQRMNDAAVVLQKHWRAHQGMCTVKHLRMELLVEERKERAATVLQKHWRRQQGRCLLKQLRMDQVVKEQERINTAAIVLQRYRRAHQGGRLVKRLKLELVVREHQTIDNAAVVLQKHWRAKQGRYLLKHLKMEQVARQQCGIDNAALVLQKHWRAKLGRSLVKHLRMEQVAREQQRPNDAAIVLQKCWRARQGRSYTEYWKLKQVAKEQQTLDHAAEVIQKHWRAQQGRCFVEQLRTEQVARVLQKLKNATIVMQRYWRAQQGRCFLKRWKLEQCVREERRIDASTVVQKHWRAHQSRALVEHMKKEELVRQREMDHAAEVLQKHWRGRQRGYLIKDLKKKQLADKAVCFMQKCSGAQQSSLTMKCLEMELDARERLRANAATTLQKHWRARQSLLIVKHMKIEEAVVEQEALDNAAIISQKHWRSQHGRFLVKHLKREKALRELKRVNSSAIVLQKAWRGFQIRQVMKLPYIKQAGIERATLSIQARVRDNATRVKFEAALTIQKAWQLYWSSRLSVSSVPIQHPFSSSSDQKRKIQAVTVLQKYARGFVVRRRLGPMSKSAYVSLQPDQSGNERYTETSMAAVTSADVMLTGSYLHAIDVIGCFSRAEDNVESCSSSSSVHHVYAGAGSADQKSSSSDRWQELECAPIISQKQDLSASLGLDGEFSATSVGKAQLEKNGVQEDWNYVAVDQLEECLDTCLAALRPIPLKLQHCLPGLGVPDKSQFIDTDQNVENNKNVEIGEAGTESNHPIKRPSDASRMQAGYVTSQATLTGGKDRLEISSRPVQVTGTQNTKNPTQGKSLGMQTAKQNEQRLKQFAHVFLLQRHIGLQQQCAQTVPPFPPPIPSGSEIPSHVVTQPVEKERGEGGAAVQIISMLADSQLSQIEGRSPEEHHVVCEIVDPDDEQIATRRSQARQKSGSKQIIERPGPDVVLDMVLLLRRIEEEYRTSEGDFEGQSRTWCTSGCGDIEEGLPLLNRNSGLEEFRSSRIWRKQSSVSKFVNAVKMKHITIPDVNAVLLVFIAMVVYTRTVCKGLLFGSRQTHGRS